MSVELAISASSGILSLSSKAIKAQFKMNDKKFGMFGTMNGIGRSFGSFLYILISKESLSSLSTSVKTKQLSIT